VTTSSKWISEGPHALLGCGIDAERIERFRGAPWDAVFCPSETRHARSLPDPAVGLCAAFCCKEALFKALRAPYNYPDCSLRLDPTAEHQQLEIAPALCEEHGIGRVEARVTFPVDGECLATVHIFGA